MIDLDMRPAEPDTRFIAVDLETTGIDSQRAVFYEIALVSAYRDGGRRERVFWMDLTDEELAAADPTALAVGRYHERLALLGQSVPRIAVDQREDFADMLASILRKQVLYAANPHFDAAFLEEFLSRYATGGRADRAPWHFKVVCIEDRVAGALGMRPPYTLSDVARELGAKMPEGRHGALVDARLVVDLEDALLERHELWIPHAA
jgi:DNA polymerase III epsilon subunit-like protein